MPSERLCSNCARPMRVLDLSGHYKRRVEIDTCPHCCLVWFDDTESVRLAGPGIADLIGEIHGAMSAGGDHAHAISLARVQRCPVCGAALKSVHNRTRFGRTTHLECPQGHGYYQTYILYLAEKGFVRPLAWSDFRSLAALGKELFCANCGCPLPSKPHEACPACQSAVGVIDPARLATAIDPGQVGPLIAAELPVQPPPLARVAQRACHACGGAIDSTRDLRCPHCNAPVLPHDAGDALEAARAAEQAARANYGQQHPAVSRAKLRAMPDGMGANRLDRPTRRLDARKIQLVGALLVGTLGLATITYYRQPREPAEQVERLEQDKAGPKGEPLLAFASQFRQPEFECAPDAARRREVRVRQLVITPGVANTASQVATLGAMRAAYTRAIAARKALESGLDFALLEERYSNPFASDRSVPFGFFKRGGALPIVEKAAFCLPVNAVGPIMLVEDGFHILQVVEAR